MADSKAAEHQTPLTGWSSSFQRMMLDLFRSRLQKTKAAEFQKAMRFIFLTAIMSNFVWIAAHSFLESSDYNDCSKSENLITQNRSLYEVDIAWNNVGD